MNSSIVNTNSDITVNNTGINRVSQRDANIYHQHEQRDDMDMSLDNNFNCHSIRTASIESIAVMAQQPQQPSCSSAIASVEEPRAKKSRKQSNPVRYGHTTQTNILPMEIDDDIPDEDNDDDDESLVAAGLRVSSELQRSGSFSSSDCLDDAGDDEDIDDERSIDLERRKLQERVTNVINFHSHKYQHFCPHCSCPFGNDDDLRSHIEEEHVQKLLERQLFHHLHHKVMLNGPNQLRPFDKYDQSQHKFNSSDSPSGSSSSGSNNNSPLQSPSGQQERKSFDTNLPHGSSDATAKEFSSNFLPFQLPPNMPPLIPMSQPGGTSADGSKSGGQSTSPGALSLAMFPNPMAPFLFPILPTHNNSGSNGSAIANGGQQVNAGGIRIFNPEAYCELCNKEFCNKYFLKTHKANKHGIYSMDTLVGNPGYGGAFFPSGLTNNSSNQSAAAAAAAIQMQHLLQSSAGLPPTSEGLVASTQVRSGIINMESYCEICQKEFCNKYFLKKHKQKIHGIADPHNQQQSSSASPGSCSNEPQNKGNSPSPPLVNTSLSLPVSMTTCMSLVPVSTPIFASAPTTTTPSAERQQQTSLMVSSQNSSPTNSYVCEICKQEFPNVLLLQTHRFTTHCPPTTLHAMMPNMSSAQLQTMAALSASESPAARSIGGPASLASSLMESGSFVFTPEKLREMGVINADAFCEICCKEFCNKYFLRTHKINKHGMSIDGTSSTKSQSGHISGDNKGEDSNNMSPNCHNDDSYLEPGQRDPATYSNGGEFFNAITGMHSELQCEICNRPFASHYLLKMHKFYSHNIPYIKEEDIRKSMASSPGASSEVPNDSTVKSASETSSNPNGQLVVTQQSNAQNSGNGQTGQLKECESSQSEQQSEPNQDQASQDLQKLQTMIKELNSSSYLDKAMCNLCRQEFENKYFLRVHMMNDHGVIPTDDASHLDSNAFMRNFFDPTRGAFSLPQTGLQTGDSEAFCDICHKEFCSKYFLKTHKQNIHGIFEGPPTPTEATPPSFPQQPSPHQFIQHRKSSDEAVNLAMSPNKNKPQMPVQPMQLISNKQLSQLPQSSQLSQMSQQSILTSQMMSSDGKPRNITGRNYCNICNKELCNKYFMKTHMLKMHGINIDEHPVEAASNSTIGGVTCDICQKELCSKYFLKVHKQNTHGIYEEPPQPKEPRSLDSSMSNNVNVNDRDSQAVHGIDPNDTNNRYFSHYTEVCPLCERRFKSIKWLKTHMINDHSDIVAMRPTDLSITGPNADLSRLCILCGQTFSDRVALHIHLVKEHRTTTEELGISGNISGMKIATTATDLSLKLDPTQQQSIAQLTQHSSPPLQIPQQSRINGTTSPSMQTNIGILSIQNSQNTNNNSFNKTISIAPNITTTNTMSNSAIILTSTPTSTITTITNPLNNNINTNTNSNVNNNSIININNNNNNNSSNTNNTSNSSSNMNMNQVNSSVITCPTINSTQSTCLTSSTPTLVTNTITCPTSTVTAKEDRSTATILSSSLSSIMSKRTGCGTRIYHCSYCNYSTRWLSNLYAHEKRHTRLNTEADKKFVCRVCHRAYRYNHSLQRHLLNHRSSGVNLRDVNAIAMLASGSSKGYLSSGSLHSTSDKLVGLDAKFSRLLSSGSSHLNLHRSGLRPARVKRYRCSKCNKKFRTRDLCLAHIHAYHSDSRKIILSTASGKMTANKVCRCAYCGFATRNYTILRIHINKNHNNNKITSSATDLTLMANKEPPESPLNLRKSIEPQNNEALSLVTNKPESAPSPSESSSSGSFQGSQSQTSGQQVFGDGSQQQPQLPMTYAMPQSPPHAGSFIMQPFLITQPDSEGSIKNDTFVPSLVYLPVSHKVLQPVRVAFQLTPA